MQNASWLMWKPRGQLFLVLKTEVLPPDTQSCHSWPDILRWRLYWLSTGKNSLAIHVSEPSHVSFQNIPYWVCHTILISFFSLNIKLLCGLFYPKTGNPRVANPCLQVKKNGLGVLWRERILLTFSVTFLWGITLADIFSLVAEILQRVGFMWEPRFTAGCVST